MRRHRCCIVAASPHGGIDFRHVHYQRPLVVLLGEERQGLSPELMRISAVRARIPMVGRADSLNVAVAGSLLLYQVFDRVHSGDGVQA